MMAFRLSELRFIGTQLLLYQHKACVKPSIPRFGYHSHLLMQKLSSLATLKVKALPNTDINHPNNETQCNDNEERKYKLFKLMNPEKFRIMSRRFTLGKRTLLPIEARNLRLPSRKRGKRKGRGQKTGKGYFLTKRQGDTPNTRVWESGRTPLFTRVPKWPSGWKLRVRQGLEPLNLAKLRHFIEVGRLDTRYPITQRHLHDSKCTKVKNGVRLFNVNDYPFPYKICIDVAGADQSTIDNIRRVGGSVSITYRDRVNLRAHIKPYKFEVLPKMARPNLQMVHYLEKMRARGCSVHYIMPLWLLEEYKKLETDLLEFRDTDEKRTKYFTLIESVHPTT